MASKLIILPSSPETGESYSAADEEIGSAISRAQENLLRQQKPDGHLCGELLVDSTFLNANCPTVAGAFITVDPARLMPR
jgi:hypothetical protein